MRFLGTIAALVGLAFGGTVLGYALGGAVGFVWVALMNTASFEGNSAMLIFFGFAPAGAVIGMLALPALYLIRKMRHASGSAMPTSSEL